MTKSLFIYGPPGCGKTRNARKLMRHFGLSKVLDGWTPADQAPPTDTLILCQERPRNVRRAMSFRMAMAQVKEARKAAREQQA